MDLPRSVQAIMEDRFLHPHEHDWYDICERNARTWGTSPEETAEFYQLMRDRKMVPNTPALANAGRKYAMASACFVLPIADSLTDGGDSIMETLIVAAKVHKAGGGTGFSGARIRGRGDLVMSTGRPAPGAVNVLELYSDAIARITQAGMRNGANMFILPDSHPDVMEFVRSKQPAEGESKSDAEAKITNFNISVAASDYLMSTIRDIDKLRWEAGSDRHWYGEIDLWDAIVGGMWENGEPGMFFIDRANKTRLHPEKFEATNPCGEVPLLPYEACVLGSVNIAAHVYEVDGHFKVQEIDWDELGSTIRAMVRMLDNIIDQQSYPDERIEIAHKKYRKIGVNPMGWADALHKLAIRYGSTESLELAERVAKFFQDTTYDESVKLADAKGPYPGYVNRDPSANVSQVDRWHYEDASLFRMLIQHELEDHWLPYRRNLCTMVGAPTGTVSRLALCSAAIEPHPNVDDDGEYKSWILTHHPYSPFTDRVYVDHKDPAFVPAREVTLEQHIRMQAAWQKYTDQAISKTINCPEATSERELGEAMILAWELGCKGVTVLREHSREHVVIGDTDCNGAACVIPSVDESTLTHQEA